MKTKRIIIAALLAIAPVLGFAQEWDDIYANPAQKQSFKTKNDQSQKKKRVVVEGYASNMRVTANGRSIDEYNRRGNTSFTDSLSAQDSTYQQYQYTDRIVRFHDPASSIKITGADEVSVYVGDDLYADYYQNRGSNTNIYFGWGASSFYPWYDSWYDPWYYGSSWGYPHYGYYGSRWYDPWYSRRGWYSPWYYSPYYGGWYDSWYYGGYYGGGYYQGYYDGYYSALPRSGTGRSSGTYRTSSANSMAASGMGSGRTSYSRSSSDIITRSSSSGRSSSYDSRDGSSRTRIVDDYGRVYDSRSGHAVDRSSYSRSSGSVYGSGRESSSRTYESATPGSSGYNRSSSSGYSRSSSSGYDRSSSGYDRSSSRSSSSYSTPSRSSSFYSEPSRGSYSGRSSFDSSSSRSSSSTSGFDSSYSRSSGSSGSSGSSSSGRSSGERR